MANKEINDEHEVFNYEVSRGTLSAINKFKEFVGEEKFNQIVSNFGEVDIPFEEDEYEKLMKIIIAKLPSQIETEKDIPYHHATELLSFFCEPFAAKQLKQARSMMSSISSLLRDLDPNAIQTMMGSTQFLAKKGSDSDAAN